MRDDTTPQSVLFKEGFGKRLIARFDQPASSSDGGAILLKACDKRLGLIDALAASVRDGRRADRIRHGLRALVEQRVYGMACGYEDCNDSARLADDPVHQLLVGRAPGEAARLASQPTLSRFENSLDGRSLVRLGTALAERVIARHRKRFRGRVHRVTLDMDPTDDPTYGAQQLSLFNGHYGTWCYLPMAAFLQFDEEPDQYLFAWVLRAGDAPATEGAVALLRRAIRRVRQAFPGVIVRVRLDGGFAAPEVFDFLDRQGVEYAVAMGKNAVLKAEAEPLMRQARRLSQASGETEHLYGECLYQAGSWEAERRGIFKAEVVRHPGRAPRDNPRLCGDRHQAGPQKRIRKDLLPARAGGEPHQGAALRTRDRSHPLHALFCQPVPVPAVRRRLRVAPGVATEGEAHRLRHSPGEHLARAPHQACRVDRVLHPPDRAASTRLCTVARRVVSDRPSARRDAAPTPPPLAQSPTQRDGTNPARDRYVLSRQKTGHRGGFCPQEHPVSRRNRSAMIDVPPEGENTPKNRQLAGLESAS